MGENTQTDQLVPKAAISMESSYAPRAPSTANTHLPVTANQSNNEPLSLATYHKGRQDDMRAKSVKLPVTSRGARQVSTSISATGSNKAFDARYNKKSREAF